MQDERLQFGVASVLAGIAVLELVLGFVYSPVLLVVAVPFGAAAYLLWYHASGRLRDRVERGRAGRYRRADADPHEASETGGFGADPRESHSGRRGGFTDGGVGAGARYRRARQGAAGGRRADPTGRSAGPSAAEAYSILGLDADADGEAIQRAYRERVKDVHPDLDSGDEEAFKRVQAAYERLQRE